MPPKAKKTKKQHKKFKNCHQTIEK